MDQRQGSVSVTLRRRWLAWLVASLVVLQIITPSRAWLVLILVVGGTLGASYYWARQMASRVSVSREQRYGWVHVGDLLEEQFVLTNRSSLPVLWAEVNDRSNLPGYNARSVRTVAGNQVLDWRTEGICQRRGIFTLGPWQVHLSDPFGLFDVVLDYPDSYSILVYPPVVHLPMLPLPRGAALGSGRTSRRAADVTTNAAGVRSYTVGDSLNHVHWPTTARTGKMMVKTFDLEPSGDLWIILDLNAAVQAGEEEESTAEYGIILAASLADRTLRENRAAGLVAWGRHDTENGQSLPTLVMPQKGTAQRWHILQALAKVQAGGDWPLDRLLAEMDRNLGRGMTMAIITPSCDPTWVAGLLPPMRRGIAPAVLLLDPESFGGSGNAIAMRSLLADVGVPAHIILQGMSFAPVAAHKRIGRPEYRVLPGTGRVIAVES